MAEIALTLVPPEVHVLVTDQVVVPARRSRLKELLLVPTSAEARRDTRAQLQKRGLPDGKKALLSTRYGRELATLASPRGELLVEHTRGTEVTRRLLIIGSHDAVELSITPESLAVSAAQPRKEAIEALLGALDVTHETKGLEPFLMHPDQLQALTLLWAGALEGAPRSLAAASQALATAKLPAADVDALAAALVESKLITRDGDTLTLSATAGAVTRAVWAEERLAIYFRETPDNDLPQHILDDDAMSLQVVGKPGQRLLVTPVDADDLTEPEAQVAPADAARLEGALVFSRTSPRALAEVLLDAVSDTDDDA